MFSQSGAFYKIIVASSLLLGVNNFSLSYGLPTASDINPTSLSRFNFRYLPSGPTGLFFTAGDIAAAESGPLFGDGAIASHPLHGLNPSGGMNMLAIGNPFVRSIVAPQTGQVDDLQVAGQSYFIEPPTSTTTRAPQVFKKRKTRRPISSLAEKSKKAKAEAANAESDNNNNEVLQGNPVPFNPFRQIVNTSFGRKRPSDNKIKQERPRSRAVAAVNQETGSTDDAKRSSVDSINEIQKTEGEPRVLPRRRPAQELRPVRPTTTDANDDSNTNADQPPKGRRVPLRRPRPSFEGATTASGNDGRSDDNTDTNAKPQRPRNLVKRLRPRPTTTIAAPSTDTDAPTETTDPVTVSHYYQPPTSPQTVPPPPSPVTEPKPRVRPARPLGVSRFANANANRNTATTTANSRDSGDEVQISSLPPSSLRRRPLRPTTRQQSLTTSTEAPEDVLRNLVKDVPSPSVRGRTEGPPKSVREGRQGFVLRPRPTPNTETLRTENVRGSVPQPAQTEEGIRQPLSNRRRKRPTTTDAAPVRPASPASPSISYNQAFTGGVVENNVVPVAPVSDRATSGRRIPPVTRTRPTPLPPLPASGGPSAYQVREEQPVPQTVRGQVENFNNPTGQFFPNQQVIIGGPSQFNGPTFQSFRRPSGPSAPSAVAPQPSPFLQRPNSNTGLVDPANFVPANPNFFQIPNQPGFFPGGFDNTLGVPSSNFRNIQRLPGPSEFSSRSTNESNDPEISQSDFSPAASTEKQSVSESIAEIEAAPASDGAEDQEIKQVEVEAPTTKAPAPIVKLTPLERLHQNRQAAARRLLAPRKPTEKTTVAPKIQNNLKAGSNFRKSIIPPRMLRARGKLPGATAPALGSQKDQEKPVPNDGRENESGAVEETQNNETGNTVPENNESGAGSAVEADTENTIPVNPEQKVEKEETSTRKPTILEAAKRRRVPASILSKNSNLQKLPTTPQQKTTKITPATPPSHDIEAAPPTCDDGQRYSKFLKRCITMYKPKLHG